MASTNINIKQAITSIKEGLLNTCMSNDKYYLRINKTGIYEIDSRINQAVIDKWDRVDFYQFKLTNINNKLSSYIDITNKKFSDNPQISIGNRRYATYDFNNKKYYINVISYEDIQELMSMYDEMELLEIFEQFQVKEVDNDLKPQLIHHKLINSLKKIKMFRFDEVPEFIFGIFFIIAFGVLSLLSIIYICSPNEEVLGLLPTIKGFGITSGILLTLHTLACTFGWGED